MDDEIDIEEHDILDHPQVKAVFPDLSKILIQVHYPGATLFEEAPATSELNNLLEERQGYEENIEEIIEDISKTVQSGDKEGNFEEEVLEEAHVISDSECNDDMISEVINHQDLIEVYNEKDEVNAYVGVSEDDKASDILLDEIEDTMTKDSDTIVIFKDKDGTIRESSGSQEIPDLERKETEDTQMIGDEDDDMEEANEILEDDSRIEDEAPIENDEEAIGIVGQNEELFESDHNINEDNEIDSENQEGDLEFDTQIRIKEEIEYEPENTEYDETLQETDYLPPEDIYHYNNKIILGSKPSPNMLVDKEVVVLLDDWDVHLNNSQSYCRNCQTLFTTPNALDAHRMTVHSLLAPITNRAVKSTAKSSVNIARKSTAKVKNSDDLSNSTYCNHCHVTFKDHTTLIKHLYELLPVKKYSCNICDATFLNQNSLVNHNSIHVKSEPRKILKAKKVENYLLKQLLNTGLRSVASKPVKRSYPIADTKNKISKPSAIKTEVPVTKYNSSYQCMLCNDILDSYGQARRHRFSHPELKKRSFMLKRLASKPQNSKEKLTYEDDTTKKREVTPFELIPKSSLFQCSKCGLHFASCVAGVSHVTGNKCNSKQKRLSSCKICKKKMRKKDENWHKKQHELSTKFKIYKITKNTYERTLCRCLKCGVYFEYIFLKKHIKKCGKIPTAKCQKCNIMLPKQKLLEHANRHDVEKMKAKDFILVDYAVINDKTKQKNVAKNTNRSQELSYLLGKKIQKSVTVKTEPTSPQPKIVSKLKFEGNKVKIYHCKLCRCFFSRRNIARSNKQHLTKKCIGKYKYTKICTVCGLRVYGKCHFSHARLHTARNLTLDDFEFYEFATFKPIPLPIPEYPACDKCGIHFLDRQMIRNHICGEDYDNCEVCGDKFENSALELHLPFHKRAKAKPAPASPMLPELMMKYESLNAIWNILFVCRKCELVTDLYNKTVEHSQAHLKKDNVQTNVIKCYICNLKFDESCWSKHSELHSRMKINNKDFKILKYDPENLLDESWFQMFESLPEKEIRQIIDRSVFGSERSLKMNLVKDGLPEFTIYCCSNCQVSYDNNNILSHVKNKCKDSKYVCRKCDVAFDAANTLEFHELLHKKGIKKEEFRIVHFVKNCEVKVKDKKEMKKEAPKPVLKVKKKVSDTPVKEKVKEPLMTLYKCVVCSVCVLHKQNQPYHKCSPANRLAYCKICKQNYSHTQMAKHKIKHKNEPKFRAKNIEVVAFEPAPDDDYKPKKNTPKKLSRNTKGAKSKPKVMASNSKCPSEQSDEPSSSKSSESVTSFESINDVTSKRKSSSHDQNDEETKTAKLYKCDCGLHYTSLRAINKHIVTCDNNDDISKENCSKCGLLFPTDILVSHLCKHHSKNIKLTVEEIHKSTKASPNVPKNTHIKLYKCSECNVYYLNQNSCYKHTSKHEPLDPKHYIECKMCCLQFRILSLHIHMKKHHENEFNLENVLVEEYYPSVGKQAPKIDIYFANERFQNVQVSSSND